jgi:hypothetical protein
VRISVVENILNASSLSCMPAVFQPWRLIVQYEIYDHHSAWEQYIKANKLYGSAGCRLGEGGIDYIAKSLLRISKVN